MGCDDEKLSKYLTHTFMAHCHTMICQQVTLSGEAEWPKVADAVIEAETLFEPLGRISLLLSVYHHVSLCKLEFYLLYVFVIYSTTKHPFRFRQ